MGTYINNFDDNLFRGEWEKTMKIYFKQMKHLPYCRSSAFMYEISTRVLIIFPQL